jgi:hypothetical protein
MLTIGNGTANLAAWIIAEITSTARYVTRDTGLSTGASTGAIDGRGWRASLLTLRKAKDFLGPHRTSSQSVRSGLCRNQHRSGK